MKKSHIIIIGFKNTGKSTVGLALANRIHEPFVDLDEVIESQFQKRSHEKISCRMIMEKYGEFYFRSLENAALKYSLQKNSSVISLGGGAILMKENQMLIKSEIVIHLTSSKEEVFHRMMLKGKPAFFAENIEAFQEFNRQWDLRQPIYDTSAHVKIMNNQSIDNTVEKIISYLRKLPYEKNSFDAWT